MNRDLNALQNTEFDLVVVGGGIFGACAAWDATLRGLNVALVEADDFGAGVSANSFKIVHGGIRYLQHADLVRLRGSCRERSAMLRIAPHLVQPLPIVIPTYGHGKSGKAFLGTGMLLYDLLTLDRNRGIADPARHIVWSKFLGRDELLAQFPGLETNGLTGGALFHDAQMYNPTRLVLAFVQSACSRGAQAANHLEVVGFTRKNDRITGIEVRDTLSDGRFQIRAKIVLNTAGPWVEHLLRRSLNIALEPKGVYSRDACFVVPRRFSSPQALAVQGRTRDPDALLSRPARHLFIVPWRDFSLIGVWHVVYRDHPSTVDVPATDLESFIDEFNWAFPAVQLTLEEVRMWNAGLVPFGENEDGAEDLSYGKRSLLIDHSHTHGIDGLVSLIGIRYTMGRGDAARAVDIVTRKLGHRLGRPKTDQIPIHGGAIDDFAALSGEIEQAGRLEPKVAEALAHNYGTTYREVLESAGAEPALAQTLGDSTVLAAEVVHAVDREMALTLADVAFRRTDLATGGHPGEAALETCLQLMARRLGWNSVRQQQELEDVLARFPKHQRQQNAGAPQLGRAAAQS